MAGPAQGDGGEEEEGRPMIRSNPQPVTHSRAATQPLLPAGQDRALLSNQLPPRVYVTAFFSFIISSFIKFCSSYICLLLLPLHKVLDLEIIFLKF